MALEAEGETTIIYPEGEMREDQIRASVEASIRRAVPGFLKTVGIWAPPQEQPPAQGGIPTTISSWNIAADQISQDYTLSPVDLTDGRVPTEIDVLAVIAPQRMTDVERFAIDQYLMGGGARSSLPRVVTSCPHC